MPIYTCRSDGSVDICPVTKIGWEARARLMKDECNYENVYHCLPDSRGRKWEKCISKTLILEGNCPMFTSDGYLDWKPCNISEPHCPNSSYVSNEVYKHPSCFGDNTPDNHTSTGFYHDQDGPSLEFIIGIVVPSILLILAAGIITLVFIIRKKRNSWTSNKVIEDMIAGRPLLPQKIGAKSSREAISEGIGKLSDENVKSIVIIGGIGNLMASTARSILEKYAASKQWNSLQCQFPDIPTSESVEPKTVMFVYGWFGLWNDDLCSEDEAINVCETLKEICKLNVKVIIGIRQDIFSKYQEKLKVYDCLFGNKITLNSERLHDEYSKFFVEEQNNCTIKNCPCKNLTIEMLSGGGDKLIGMPLKVDVISKHHDSNLIQSYISKDKDILRAMTDHFSALKETEETNPIYEWIMYICLKGQFSRYESFDKDLVKKLKYNITFSSFDNHFMELRKYIRVWFSEPHKISTGDAKYVFWHPFIYVCAFHSLYENHKDTVIENCNVDAIFQLIRPKTYAKTEYHLEVSACDADVKQFRARLCKLDLPERYKNHPLLTEQPFTATLLSDDTDKTDETHVQLINRQTSEEVCIDNM